MRRPSPAPPPPARPRPDGTLVTGGLGLSATLAAVGGVLLAGAEMREEAVLAAASAAGPNGCFRVRWPMCQQAAAAHGEMRAFRQLGVAGLITGERSWRSRSDTRPTRALRPM